MRKIRTMVLTLCIGMALSGCGSDGPNTTTSAPEKMTPATSTPSTTTTLPLEQTTPPTTAGDQYPDEDLFLLVLRSYGEYAPDVQRMIDDTPDRDLLEFGYQFCDLMAQGFTEDEVIDMQILSIIAVEGETERAMASAKLIGSINGSADVLLCPEESRS